MDALTKTPDPTISLSTAADHRVMVYIQIPDNGRGIDETLTDKVFIPYYTTKPHGSGIGLSTSRQIMRFHGGAIHIQSALGKGSTVTLSF